MSDGVLERLAGHGDEGAVVLGLSRRLGLKSTRKMVDLVPQSKMFLSSSLQTNSICEVYLYVVADSSSFVARPLSTAALADYVAEPGLPISISCSNQGSAKTPRPEFEMQTNGPSPLCFGCVKAPPKQVPFPGC